MMGIKILLIHPDPKMPFPKSLPQSILHVTSPLLKAGYDVKIIDRRVQDLTISDLKDILFAGITTLTSCQILYAINDAEYIRRHAPTVPIVWGGIHPTLLPEQTLHNEYVDIIVEGEGENTVLELARALANKNSLAGIPGLSYKENGKIMRNAHRQPISDLDSLPFLPYNLLSLDKYDLTQARLHTSRGCPHRCKFCYNQALENHGSHYYRAKSPERVIEEIKYVINNLNPKRIYFSDDNFFHDLERVRTIVALIVKENLKFKWKACARVEQINTFDNEYLKLLLKSGCEEISIGVESGSPKVLRHIKKGITLPQVESAYQKLVKYDIIPAVNFIVGFPNENKLDILRTIEEAKKLREFSKAMRPHIQIYILHPGFGTPIYNDIIKKGFETPQNLRDWGFINFGDALRLTYLPLSTRRYIQTIFYVYLFLTEPPGLLSKKKERKTKLFYSFLNHLILSFFKLDSFLRWFFNWFEMGWEWQLLHKYINNHYRDIYFALYNKSGSLEQLQFNSLFHPKKFKTKLIKFLKK